jgi:hypothetical protein
MVRSRKIQRVGQGASPARQPPWAPLK